MPEYQYAQYLFIHLVGILANLVEAGIDRRNNFRRNGITAIREHNIKSDLRLHDLVFHIQIDMKRQQQQKQKQKNKTQKQNKKQNKKQHKHNKKHQKNNKNRKKNTCPGDR